MRGYEFQSGLTLTLLGVLLSSPGVACEPPAGFVNPPRPEVAPLDNLLSHTEVIEVARPLTAPPANRPLQDAIRPTKDLAGVSGTFRLSDGPYGTVGARRLVCKTDGHFSVEEVLLTESTDGGTRFRYVVWHYTSPKFRDGDYAVGEIVRTAPSADKTRVDWTYRFSLKKGRDSAQFRKSFLDSIFAEWMRSQLERGKTWAESGR